jgi:hypothetical protein
MTHRYLECFAATAIACVAATALATAQTAPGRPEDGRNVTAVGCLKQERDIPGRTAAVGETGKPAEGFVLLNARITSAALPEAPITSDPATGAASAAAAERERKTAPSGAPGAAGAGTSGTESTSAQSSDRPPSDAARGQVNAAPVRGTETMYKVVGLPVSELTSFVGQQVEIQATLDASTMGTAALRQPGTTMGGEPASTPSASTPPAPTQAPATQADRQDTRPATATLPELKATAIRTAGGRCQGT